VGWNKAADGSATQIGWAIAGMNNSAAVVGVSVEDCVVQRVLAEMGLGACRISNHVRGTRATVRVEGIAVFQINEAQARDAPGGGPMARDTGRPLIGRSSPRFFLWNAGVRPLARSSTQAV